MGGEGLLAGPFDKAAAAGRRGRFRASDHTESECEDYARGRRREIARKRDILAIEDDAYWS